MTKFSGDDWKGNDHDTEEERSVGNDKVQARSPRGKPCSLVSKTCADFGIAAVKKED